MSSGEYNHQRGQSVIFVALLFLVLLLFVALAVDIANAYFHRRIAQNAVDAAALAAAQELGHHLRGDPDVEDSDVKDKLDEFGQRNGVDNVTGSYLDENLTPLTAVGAGSIPTGALGIEATAQITAPTYFGGIVGLDGIGVDAEAAVRFEEVCYGGPCLLPIAIHGVGFEPDDEGDEIPEFIDGQCYNLWDGIGPGNFGWVNWSTQGEEYSCLHPDNPEPSGDCSADCLEYNMNPDYCRDNADNMVMVGDEVGGQPGVKNADAVREWLDYYITEEIPARILVYTETVRYGGSCGKTLWPEGKQQGQFYIVAGFAAFQITGYRLSHGGGAVVTDTHGISPTLCLDYPNLDGLCCPNWEDMPDEFGEFECEFDDEEWEPCDYETGNVNRITGISRLWTEDSYVTCEDAVGTFLAPVLVR